MGASGGSLIREYLDEMRAEIREYYGLLNELRMGARSKPPPRPDYIGTYEMYKKFKTLPYAGGFSDQPYLWVVEYMVIESEVSFMERLAEEAMKTK